MENENVCPYCGTEIDLESLPSPMDDEIEIECGECGKTFYCEPITSYLISTMEEILGEEGSGMSVMPDEPHRMQGL